MKNAIKIKIRKRFVLFATIVNSVGIFSISLLFTNESLGLLQNQFIDLFLTKFICLFYFSISLYWEVSLLSLVLKRFSLIINNDGIFYSLYPDKIFISWSDIRELELNRKKLQYSGNTGEKFYNDIVKIRYINVITKDGDRHLFLSSAELYKLKPFNFNMTTYTNIDISNFVSSVARNHDIKTKIY